MCEGLFFCWILSVDLYILLFDDNCIYLLVEQTHSSINSNNTFYCDGDRGMFIFPVQLTTSRIGNLTRLIHTLLHVMTIL